MMGDNICDNTGHSGGSDTGDHGTLVTPGGHHIVNTGDMGHRGLDCIVLLLLHIVITLSSGCCPDPPDIMLSCLSPMLGLGVPKSIKKLKLTDGLYIVNII